MSGDLQRAGRRFEFLNLKKNSNYFLKQNSENGKTVGIRVESPVAL